MPWRRTPSPYRIWVSEIMLQQTRVDTVIPYFNRFMKAFPSLKQLANASLQDVLKVWEGLGYYSRARNLHKAARFVVTQRRGRLPTRYSDLLALPGVGAYTAAAIAGIAYGEPVPAVDGNVLRVFARFLGIRDNIRRPATARTIREFLAPVVNRTDPRRFNQALMELGALICGRRAPKCAECPLRRECVARRSGTTAQLPVTPARRPIPHHEIAVGVIWRRNKVLLARRHADQMLGGLWEFPGGKRLPNESLRRTARREILEETGLKVRVGKPYCTVKHAYSHFKITLTAFRCTHAQGRAKANAAAEVKWVGFDKLVEYPMPRANTKVLETIRNAVI